MSGMRPEERLRYCATIDRPKVALPGGKAVAVWPVVNVEHWLIDNPMPRQVLVAPTGAQLLPDVANWAWHEYGMRVGFWRLLAAFEKRKIRPTLSINGSVCTAYPRISQAAHAAGHDRRPGPRCGRRLRPPPPPAADRPPCRSWHSPSRARARS